MKILFISIVFCALLASIAIGMNLLMGFTFYQSMDNVLNPFRVMEIPEWFIILFFLILWGLDRAVAVFLRQKRW
jgi:hypothetical protein